MTTALIPLRAQPLHLGHCNLLIDVCQRYEHTIVLLSPRVGDSRNPYNYQQRVNWLQIARDVYGITYEIAPLPSFSSSHEQEKSIQEILTIQGAFEMLAGSDNFVIISGNIHVITAARTLYNFDALLIGEDYLPVRHLSQPAIFGTQLAGNSEMIRQWLATPDIHHQKIATHLPSWVYDDLIEKHNTKQQDYPRK